VGVQPSEPGSLDTNGVFNDQNTNKVSVRLNVNQPKGLELVKEIIKRSDIVLNNYTAERMPRWGLGYEDLKALKSDIVMLSMPVMGTTGPLRNYGSYGNGVIAFGGLNSITGLESRPPVGLGPLYSDFSGPYLVITAVMAALHRRNQTGEGCFVDFSQAEATTSLLGPAVLEYTANGELPRRRGNRSDEASPHGVFPCEGDDRWCAIAVYTDAEWSALCDAMGQPELANDARFATFESRKANEDALEAVVATWTATQEPWALMHILQGRGIMASVVEDLEDMCVRDPWLSRKHLVELPFEEEGISFRTHQQPVRFDGQLPELRRAPRFGEHSQEVLQGLLGISEDEFTQLMVDQVVF
jgi:benzylsuccinate CoA-transferase BbsF subunit